MFTLGIIEESLQDKEILEVLKSYLHFQRIENIPEDECPIWHTNEYHVPADKMPQILDELKDNIKLTWYIHAFNEKTLYVVLQGKWFQITPKKNETWDDMIKYGVDNAKVERRYLENIPLHV